MLGSDSESDWSSFEGLQRDPYQINHKAFPHKKVRKKRGIPVAPPCLPSFESGNSLQFFATTYQNSSNSGVINQHKLNSSSSSNDTIEQGISKNENWILILFCLGHDSFLITFNNLLINFFVCFYFIPFHC